MTPAAMELVGEAFASNWIAPLGPQVDAFEEAFARTVDVPHAVALSSGTAALHLALLTAGVTGSSEVMVSDLTFAASANAVIYAGARPVFVDADPSTWNMDPDLLASSLMSRAQENRLPSAVMTVDLYGQSADHDRILQVCQEYEVPVIEDAAEALGATYKGAPVGRFGASAAFSFNGNKIITTSGGGMLVSDDEAVIARARWLATQARDPAPHYQHSTIGFNYRMSNVLAAIGLSQLAVLEERVAARREVFARYQTNLGELPGIDFMPEAPYGRSTRWLTCLTIDPLAFGATREDVRIALDDHDIEARPVWKPMHLQPVFAGSEVVGGSVSERLFEFGLCLPSGSALTEGQIDMVSDIGAEQHRN